MSRLMSPAPAEGERLPAPFVTRPQRLRPAVRDQRRLKPADRGLLALLLTINVLGWYLSVLGVQALLG